MKVSNFGQQQFVLQDTVLRSPTYDRVFVSTLFSDPRGGQVVCRRVAASLTSAT